ncbi:hypothetical protein C0J52_19169 [Blattella germanica]|nr:hypothetical protein C0J52_19169 [Blattella germanica]
MSDEIVFEQHYRSNLHIENKLDSSKKQVLFTFLILHIIALLHISQYLATYLCTYFLI